MREDHRFAVLDIHTYKEKFSFQVSGGKVIFAIVIAMLLVAAFTTVIIFFTGVRELVPGYANAEMMEQTYRNSYVIDSLEHELLRQEWMINSIQQVVSGKEMPSAAEAEKQSDSLAALGVSASTYTRSRADSLLRIYVDQNDYGNDVGKSRSVTGARTGASGGTVAAASADVYANHGRLRVTRPVIDFMRSPVRGEVIADFNPSHGVFGVDVSSMAGSEVLASYVGTVVFAGYTSDAGNVIIIQHPGNVLTVYKHCSLLLKRCGDMVQAGEAVGYLGNTGYLSTAPHLRYEIWVSGQPENPREYLKFE